MQKFIRPELLAVLIVIVLVLLWRALDEPISLNGASPRQTAKATVTAISPNQDIAQTKAVAPAKPEATPTDTSGEGYHFQLSEPPLPFLDNYGSPTTTGEDDLKAVKQAVVAYLNAIHDSDRPPTGTNAEFTRVLSGDNPLHVAFIPQTHIVNGELTDRWGTPLFFHEASGQQVDVTSAGPDRKLWTSDDVIAPPEN